MAGPVHDAHAFPRLGAGRHRRAADRWFWGGFPPIHGLRDAHTRSEWFDAYVLTFLERDLPAPGPGLRARRLRTLWTMLTHVHAIFAVLDKDYAIISAPMAAF